MPQILLIVYDPTSKTFVNKLWMQYHLKPQHSDSAKHGLQHLSNNFHVVNIELATLPEKPTNIKTGKDIEAYRRKYKLIVEQHTIIILIPS
jgi:hypothetical protein